MDTSLFKYLSYYNLDQQVLHKFMNNNLNLNNIKENYN